MFFSVILGVILFWLVKNVAVPLAVLVVHFFVKGEKHVVAVKRSGEWAVVTGGTDGIGLEYCRALARLGRNVVIVGRSEERLRDVAEELKRDYRVETAVFKTDFRKTLNYEELRQYLDGLDIGVLVNNVGMTQPFPCQFHELQLEPSFFIDMVNCNVLSCVFMTNIVVPKMVQRKRGIIINISSASSLGPMPRSALYSSSKAYMTQFSRSLSFELRNTGVMVQTVRPFFVQTKFIGKFRPPRLLTPNAKEFVESAITMVGVESDTFGTFSHSLQALIYNLFPTYVTTTATNFIYCYRTRCLRQD